MQRIIGTVNDGNRVSGKVMAAVKLSGLIWKGEYDPLETYFYNEVVSITKAYLLYVCIEDDLLGVTGKNPQTSASSWQFMTGFAIDFDGKTEETFITVDPINETLKDSGVALSKIVPSAILAGFFPKVNSDSTGYEQSAVSESNILLLEEDREYIENELTAFTSSLAGSPHTAIGIGLTADQVKYQLGYVFAFPESFLSRKTNGAAYTTEESTTYDQVKGIWLFDATTSEGIQIAIPNYATGSLTTANFKYRLRTKIPISGTEPTAPNNTVQWRCKAAFEKQTIDIEWGTAVGIKQTHTAGEILFSDWSDLVTAAGDVAADVSMIIEINRYSDDATNDLLAQDIALIGVEFQFNLPNPS